MKDQYFGDAADLFKYQLLEQLLEAVASLKRLVCLWMLTPPDASREGNVSFEYPLGESSLADFLRRSVQADDRRVRHLRSYFSGRPFLYVPWGDEPPYFGPRRQDYFDSLPPHVLSRALVFFDPDIGLTSATPTRKHLAFCELAEVFQRMAKESVAVVFQYRARIKDYWNLRAKELRRELGVPVRYVADARVAFYIVTKALSHDAAIETALEQVASKQALRIVGSG